MRHCKRTAKLGRTSEHRTLMLANLVCSLIKHRRVTTTLAKARAARSVAEKMITLGKSGTIHDRRLAASRLHQEDAVRILFNEIAPSQKDRPGGYTRIVKLLPRKGDAAPLAILEWVDEALQERPRTTETKASEAPQPKPDEAAGPTESPGPEASGDDSQAAQNVEEESPTPEKPGEKS